MGDASPTFRSLSLVRGETPPLAIRFWDPVLNAPVGDGLTASVRLANGQGAVVAGAGGPAGLYRFPGMPGWQRLLAAGPDCLLTVTDARGRFLPLLLRLPGPLPAQLEAEEPESPDAPRRLLLCSAPARPVPTGMVALRGQLWDHAADAPAAYAAVAASDGSRSYAGAADERGCLALILPVPPLRPALRNGNGNGGGWRPTLRVRYGGSSGWSPAAPPDLARLDDQPPGLLFATLNGPPAPQLDLAPQPGRDLILRTDQLPFLYVQPGTRSGSP